MQTQTQKKSQFQELRKQISYIESKPPKLFPGDINIFGPVEFRFHFKMDGKPTTQDTIFFSYLGFAYMLVFDLCDIIDTYDVPDEEYLTKENLQDYITRSRADWVPELNWDESDLDKLAEIITSTIA